MVDAGCLTPAAYTPGRQIFDVPTWALTRGSPVDADIHALILAAKSAGMTITSRAGFVPTGTGTCGRTCETGALPIGCSCRSTGPRRCGSPSPTRSDQGV